MKTPDKVSVEINKAAPVQCSKSILISADQKKVWDLLTGINGWPRWQRDISESRLEGTLSAGSEFLWKSGGTKIRSTVHTLDPAGTFGWTGKAPGLTAIHNWYLEERDGLTEVKVEESMEGPLAKLFRKSLNRSLEKGMQSRPRDYTLPFYIGFNYAYFLKDYPRAAVFMQKAAELSGNPLYTQLTARFFYESEQSSLGLAFLESMIRSAKDKAVRKSYELRRDALLATTLLEKARDAYRAESGHAPKNPEELVNKGFLPAVPTDPYGGTFFFDDDGRVRTTSKLAVPQEWDKGLD